MPPGIATGFIRKLYLMLEQESDAIISWANDGKSFCIHDAAKLNDKILPKYNYRGKLQAFRQQLIDHGFEQLVVDGDASGVETYFHEHFMRGCPAKLPLIERIPKRDKQRKPPKRSQMTSAGSVNTHAHAHAGGNGTPVGRSDVDPSGLHGNKRLRVHWHSPTNASSSGGSGHDGSATNVVTTTPPASNSLLFSTQSTMTTATSASTAPMAATLPNNSAFASSRNFPEPIRYLEKQLGSFVSSDGTFPEEMVRAAMYFILSTSTTGVDNQLLLKNTQQNRNLGIGSMKPSDTATFPVVNATSTTSSTTTMTSNASSTTTTSTETTAAAIVAAMDSSMAQQANPLFSDSLEDRTDPQDKISSTDKQRGGEEDLWAILMSSSIDKARTAISDVSGCREKLQKILEEKERLDQETKAKAASMDMDWASLPNWSNTGSAASLGFGKADSSVSSISMLSSLSSSSPASSIGSSAASPSSATAAAAAAAAPFKLPLQNASDEDLWKILMSSSIDVLKRVGEQVANQPDFPSSEPQQLAQNPKARKNRIEL